MIPGGSITNRSELGVNIQKNPGLIQKNGQEIFQNEQYASSQPHFRIGLPRFRSTCPVSERLLALGGFSEMPPFIAPYSGPHTPARFPALGRFSGRCLRLSRRLRSPTLRPGSRLWEGFRGDATVYHAASNPPASPHPGCGEDTALRTASPSFRPDGQTRRG